MYLVSNHYYWFTFTKIIFLPFTADFKHIFYVINICVHSNYIAISYFLLLLYESSHFCRSTVSLHFVIFGVLISLLPSFYIMYFILIFKELVRRFIYENNI